MAKLKWLLLAVLVIFVLMFVACEPISDSPTSVEKKGADDSISIAEMKDLVENVFLELPYVHDMTINRTMHEISFSLGNDVEEIKASDFYIPKVNISFLDEDDRKVDAISFRHGENYYSVIAQSGANSLAYNLIIAYDSTIDYSHTHKYGSWKTVTKASCTQKGLKKKTCSICGDEVTEIIPLSDHTTVIDAAVTATCTTSGLTEGKHCSICSKTIVSQSKTKALGHSYSVKQILPTCTENGFMLHTCSRCNDSYMDNQTRALGHEYFVEKVPASCTHGGYTMHICARCESDYVDEQTDALGHDYAEWVIYTSATCIAEGEERRQCLRCDYYDVRSIEIDSNNHDLIHHEAKEPTTTSVGWNAYDTCSRCSYSTYQELPIALYKVTWLNWDGTILETDLNVNLGEMPHYDGNTPQKASSAQYLYTFSGWSPEVQVVTSNVVYIAQFVNSIRFTSISIPAEIHIDVGVPYEVTYTGKPSNASENVYLRINNPNIITQGKNNYITATSVGKASVYFETESGLISDQCTVIVSTFQDVDLPISLNNTYLSFNGIAETAEIKSVNLRFVGGTSGTSIHYDMYLYKTYAHLSGSLAFNVNYKIKDPNDVIVKSGTIASSSFEVNETVFVTGSISLPKAAEAGVYRITFSGVSWVP